MVEREAGIVEPVLENRAVSGEDRVGLTSVRDDGKPRAAEREVALMRLHGGLDHAARKPEEPLVEPAFEDEGRFDEVHDLVELPKRIRPGAESVEPLL